MTFASLCAGISTVGGSLGSVGGLRAASMRQLQNATPHRNKSRSTPRQIAKKNRVVSTLPTQLTVINTGRPTIRASDLGGTGGIAWSRVIPASSETGTNWWPLDTGESRRA